MESIIFIAMITVFILFGWFLIKKIPTWRERNSSYIFASSNRENRRKKKKGAANGWTLGTRN